MSLVVKSDIKFTRKAVDNGKVTCKDCKWYEGADFSIGHNNECCGHPIIYDDNGNVIEEANELCVEAMRHPVHCVLFEAKR